jgi:hypothetical protein
LLDEFDEQAAGGFRVDEGDLGVVGTFARRFVDQADAVLLEPGDGVILFGSRATGRARPDSDYDIAVLSRDFGKNRFDEGVLLNIHAHRIHPDFESIPVSLHQWFEPFPASPIIQQIKEHGIFLI